MLTTLSPHRAGTYVLLTATLTALAGCAVSKPDAAPSRARVVSEAEFSCLREAVYFEAGGIGAGGGRAVADVILNRAADPRFPGTICGVVREGEGSGRGCQFSYRCDGRAEAFAEPRKLRLADKAAREALARTEDTTNGALYFHSMRVAPGWFGTLKRTAAVGGNIFYKP